MAQDNARPVTLKAAQAEAKALGLTIRKTEGGDFRVAFPRNESAAAYESSVADALDTARAMAAAAAADARAVPAPDAEGVAVDMGLHPAGAVFCLRDVVEEAADAGEAEELADALTAAGLGEAAAQAEAVTLFLDWGVTPAEAEGEELAELALDLAREGEELAARQSEARAARKAQEDAAQAARNGARWALARAVSEPRATLAQLRDALTAAAPFGEGFTMEDAAVMRAEAFRAAVLFGPEEEEGATAHNAAVNISLARTYGNPDTPAALASDSLGRGFSLGNMDSGKAARMAAALDDFADGAKAAGQYGAARFLRGRSLALRAALMLGELKAEERPAPVNLFAFEPVEELADALAHVAQAKAAAATPSPVAIARRFAALRDFGRGFMADESGAVTVPGLALGAAAVVAALSGALGAAVHESAALAAERDTLAARVFAAELDSALGELVPAQRHAPAEGPGPFALVLRVIAGNPESGPVHVFELDSGLTAQDCDAARALFAPYTLGNDSLGVACEALGPVDLTPWEEAGDAL